MKYARDRIRDFLGEVHHIGESEFPYDSTKCALAELESCFKGELEKLDDLDETVNDERTIKDACANALGLLHEYVPFLGFILRSTNVRNAFEIYAPLQRLCESVLEPDVSPLKRTTRLILSSEWTYQPQVYPEKDFLPSYVMIGLPAPESSNPLLLPLAGHELGHSLWRSRNLGDELNRNVVRAVIESVIKHSDLLVKTYQSEITEIVVGTASREELIKFLVNNMRFFTTAIEWAKSQAEETFCDFVGLNLFGVSYFKAFAYLASPRLSMQRVEEYPRLTTRTQNLVDVAPRLGVEPPKGFAGLFEDDPEADHQNSIRFNLTVADEALEALRDIIFEKAQALLSGLVLTPTPDRDEVHEILRWIKHVVPAKDARSLADILNAAWLAFEDETLWTHIPELHEKKDEVLKELILKNIEIFEIERRQKE